MPRYEFNAMQNGIEIYFESMPPFTIRNEVKANGFRWNPYKKCWYATQSEVRLSLAKKLCFYEDNCAQSENSNLEDDVSSQTSDSYVEPPMNRKYCYADNVENFLQEEKNKWKAEMRSAFREETDLPLGNSQIEAWADCFDVLKNVMDESIGKFNIIYEYVLPYENGRRPDVLLVSKEVVIILEFKRKSVALTEDLDQAADYARDIREYHYESSNKHVYPLLVLTRTSGLDYKENGVIVCSSDNLRKNIDKIVSIYGNITPCDLQEWIDSKYEPLPTMVEAARRFWNGEKLPNIKHAHAGTNIDEAIKCLKTVSNKAAIEKQKILALVTGVPGAGKTFLGLQFVYDVSKVNGKQNSVFLSGNGPLVEVLQDALQNRTFVNDVNKIVRQFIDYNAVEFNRNIIVFDEGQRAWDKARMTKSYQKKSNNMTEPDVLIQLCDEKLEWCVFLVLVGEGQEINTGENGGIVQWYDAIARSSNEWQVVCSPKLAEVFEGTNIETYDDLDLKVSIRSHTAGEVSNFINKFVAGDIKGASELVYKIPQEDFHMYYTRDLSRAKAYCRGKYESQPEKHYGMIVSSKDYSLARLGMPQPVWKNRVKIYPDGSGRRWQVASWFNKPSNHPDSCCALTVAITEFDCQGLEIDMPIVGWGEDAIWENGHWNFKGSNDENVTYRNNSYRVLLTRGREGFIVYIPQGRDDIANVFEKVGIKELKV